MIRIIRTRTLTALRATADHAAEQADTTARAMAAVRAEAHHRAVLDAARTIATPAEQTDPTAARRIDFLTDEVELLETRLCEAREDNEETSHALAVQIHRATEAMAEARALRAMLPRAEVYLVQVGEHLRSAHPDLRAALYAVRATIRGEVRAPWAVGPTFIENDGPWQELGSLPREVWIAPDHDGAVISVHREYAAAVMAGRRDPIRMPLTGAPAPADPLAEAA